MYYGHYITTTPLLVTIRARWDKPHQHSNSYTTTTTTADAITNQNIIPIHDNTSPPPPPPLPPPPLEAQPRHMKYNTSTLNFTH
ncbi:hypothetical protein E2C01_071511 [Portunus trituberculatus]|uniref:Uncharacterized protein n=1 Tax=Portunus trituberculatus TaxID=210409 RepID=A0A5B7I6E3_PORTR|nr:hypothetical protein [Portunus trituberculatus]